MKLISRKNVKKTENINRPLILAVVRHAESERNKAKKNSVYFADDEARKIIKGIPDHKIPLTPEGIVQAEKTGIALKKRFGTFDYIYHPGYLRTTQTMEGILKAWPEKERLKIKIRQNAFLRERDPGYTYDMTETEAATAFPWLKEYWQTFGGFFSRPVGGESMAQVVERVYLFLNMLFRDRSGQKVLIITHGGTIKCLRFLLEHWDYERALSSSEGCENCSLTLYEYRLKEKKLALKERNTVYWK